MCSREPTVITTRQFSRPSARTGMLSRVLQKTSQKHRTGGAKHQNKYITWKLNLSPTQWCKYNFNWISFKTQTFHLKVVSIDFSRILQREPCLPGLLLEVLRNLVKRYLRLYFPLINFFLCIMMPIYLLFLYLRISLFSLIFSCIRTLASGNSRAIPNLSNVAFSIISFSNCISTLLPSTSGF